MERFSDCFEGKSYSRSESIPDGLEFEITGEDGATLSLQSDPSITSSSGSSSKSSIGYVELENPTRLTVSVVGDTEPRVFSFSQSDLLEFFGLIVVGFGLSTLIAISGLGLSIWGIVKLVKDQKGESGTSSDSPSPGPPV